MIRVGLILLLFVGSLSVEPPTPSSYYPFGTILGENRGVYAYSNGGGVTNSSGYNYVGPVFTGVKWQCVEYSRRWLILTQNITFDSVAVAADIWSLENWKSSADGSVVPIVLHENGNALSPPVPGSLLIYPVGQGSWWAGHVAVITDVAFNRSYVYLTEENYDDTVLWLGTRNYSRALPLIITSEGRYEIVSQQPVKGWITPQSPQSYDKSDSVSLWIGIVAVIVIVTVVVGTVVRFWMRREIGYEKV